MLKINFSFKAYLAIAVIAVGSVTFFACNSQDQPSPFGSSNQTATVKSSAFAEPEIFIEDDGMENARAGALDPAVAMTYRFRAIQSCANGEPLILVYKEGNETATSLSDSTRSKGYPKGTWKSITIKPDFFDMIVGKKLDKTKSYTFYSRNKTTKTSQRLLNIAANPIPFEGNYKNIFSFAYFDFTCTTGVKVDN